MISKTTFWFYAINIFIITATNGQQQPPQPRNSICTVQRRVPGRKSLGTVRHCCPGYKQDLGSVSLKCDPVCSPTCLLHSTCTAPDRCTCDVGFTKPRYDDILCFPRCSHSCINGACIQPEVCQCNIGYLHKTNNYTCSPFCSGGCEHGSCVAPDVCQFDTGSSEAPNGNSTEFLQDNFNYTNIPSGTNSTSVTAQDHGFNFMYVWMSIAVILLVVIATIVFGFRSKLFYKVCTRVETYDPNETNTASDNVCVKFSDLPINHQDELTKM